MEWLEIKKHPITGNKNYRIILYTPNKNKIDLTMEYRVISIDLSKIMKDATHWMLLNQPEKK